VTSMEVRILAIRHRKQVYLDVVRRITSLLSEPARLRWPTSNTSKRARNDYRCTFCPSYLLENHEPRR
jgi:hypothetical protein